MGTIYRFSETTLKVGTTRTLTVNTGAATKVTLNEGYGEMVVGNIGPSTIAWGDSSITASSAGLIYYSQSEIFKDSVYLVADSVAGTVFVNEMQV